MCYYDMYSSRAVEYEKISPSLSPPLESNVFQCEKSHANKPSPASSLFSQKPKISQKHSVNAPRTPHPHIPSPASSEADLFSWHISCEWLPKSIFRVKRERGSIMIFGGTMLRLRLLFCSLSLLRLSRMYVSRIDALPFFFFFWKRKRSVFLGGNEKC